MKPSVRPLFAMTSLWFAAATLAGALHLLSRLPVPLGPLFILASIAAFVAAVRWVPSLAAGAGALPPRGIVAVHLVRFLGFYFLWLQARGRLPTEFAQRAGWGDVAAACGAAFLLVLPEGVVLSRVLRIWNWCGLADLAIAVGTGGWLTVTRPGSMDEIARLPMAWVPLWIVPVLAASHSVLLRARPGMEGGGAGRGR